MQQSDETGDVNGHSSVINGGSKWVDGHEHHLNEKLRQERKMERENRQNIVLWKKPLITLQYFMLELIITSQEYWRRFIYLFYQSYM